MNYGFKDNGEKESFETGAVRDVQSDKPAIHLISPHFLERLGTVMRKGANKYDDRNWEKGIDNDRLLASAYRHLVQYHKGDRDEDHLGHLAFNIMALIHNEEMIERGLLSEKLDNIPEYS